MVMKNPMSLAEMARRLLKYEQQGTGKTEEEGTQNSEDSRQEKETLKKEIYFRVLEKLGIIMR